MKIGLEPYMRVMMNFEFFQVSFLLKAPPLQQQRNAFWSTPPRWLPPPQSCVGAAPGDWPAAPHDIRREPELTHHPLGSGAAAKGAQGASVKQRVMRSISLSV